MAELREQGLISGTEPYVHDVPHSHRSGRADRAADLAAVVLRHGRAGRAGDRGRRATAACASTPSAWTRRLPELAREHPPVVHLAPALVGPPAAGLVLRRRGDLRGRRAARAATAGSATPTCSTPGSRPALWPFATLGWPEETPELRAFYPTDVISTARDIIFLWVARMVMFGHGAHGRAAVHGRGHPLGDPGARRAAHVEVARHRDRPARPDRWRRAGRAASSRLRATPALRPARDVVVPGRALQRGAGQAGPATSPTSSGTRRG